VPNDVLVDDPAGEENTTTIQHVNNRVTMHNNIRVFSPPPAQRRRRPKISGKWGSRMVALRSSRSTGFLKLNHKVFARHGGTTDLNNPRKLAKSYLEITILGSYEGPWTDVPEDCTVTLLGYVHSHIRRKHSIQLLNRDRLSQNQNVPVQNDYLAWCTFRLSTARIINLECFCRLKIYDAVILPCPPTEEIELPGFLSTNGEIMPKQRCDSIIVGTDLCERIDSSE
jgi:hypothetical protein